MNLPYKIRLLKDFIPLYTGAGAQYVKIGSVSNWDLPIIIEERQGKGAKLWGRLKSGAGWVPLDDTEAISDEGIQKRCD